MSEVMTGEIQNLIFNNQAMDMLFRLAETMAQGTVTVPDHLRGKPGDCLAICMQAAQWKMNPFAVAQKTHIVNGKLGYEAQLVNAVVQTSGAIIGTFKYEYSGDGETLQCRVGAIIAGESSITWSEWLGLWQVAVKNSPLWKSNPKQQMGYLQVKNWSRAFCPGAILGVYTADELEATNAPRERDITPRTPSNEPDALPYYPSEKFEQNFVLWEKAILGGRRTTADILNMAESKGFQLTNDQRQAILNINQGEAA